MGMGDVMGETGRGTDAPRSTSSKFSLVGDKKPLREKEGERGESSRSEVSLNRLSTDKRISRGRDDVELRYMSDMDHLCMQTTYL